MISRHSMLRCSATVIAIVQAMPVLAQDIAGSSANAAMPAPRGEGAVRGRVFNTATDEYVRNAEVRVAGSSTVAYSSLRGPTRATKSNTTTSIPT